MYNNAGKSIKGLVKIVVGVQMALFIIVGIVIMASGYDGEMILPGLLVAVIGCFLAWMSGLVLYAFGDIADGVKQIEASLACKASPEIPQADDESVAAANQNVSNWICYTCKTENPRTRAYCINCNTSRNWSEEKTRKG